MGNSQVPYFAYEDPLGRVVQVTLVDWNRKAEVLAKLAAAGLYLPGAPVVDHPDLPSTPSHRWRIRNGQVVDDPTVPDPPKNRRAQGLEDLAAATTIAQVKAALARVLG